MPVKALDIYSLIAVKHFPVPGAGMQQWAEPTKVLPLMTQPHVPGGRQETNKKAKYRSDGGKCSGEFNREGGRAGQAEEQQSELGRLEKGGLSGKNITKVREKTMQISGAEPCMAGEIGMCSVHLRKCKEASVPGARGG